MREIKFLNSLQDKLVDDMTIAYLLGYTTTVQIQKTYKRHRPKNQHSTIAQLSMPDLLPYSLNL